MAANEAACKGRNGNAATKGATAHQEPDGWPDRAALEELYNSQSPRLLRLLRRRVADADEARDLLHDIFVRLVRSAGIAGLARPEAYLTRIATNLLADRARRGQAGGGPVSYEESELPSTIDPILHLETRDTLSRIEAAMRRLKPRTREIFVAHRLEGMSYGEIADRFGLSVKGVEKQMSKAIAQIDRMLDRR